MTPEPTQTFYAIAGGFLLLALAGVIWYLFKGLITEVKERVQASSMDEKFEEVLTKIRTLTSLYTNGQ